MLCWPKQTRFAFARILATASFIPPLMGNLLAHFEPCAELERTTD